MFKLKSNNYIDSTEFPREKPAFSILEDIDIVDRYDRMIVGIANYYKICDNNGTINYVNYLLKFSCAKTLAQRHRLTVGKIFKKHGKNLKVFLRTKDNYIRTSELTVATKWIQNFKLNPKQKFYQIPLFDPFKLHSRWRTKIKPYLHCCSCGSNIRIEMHHVRSVRSGRAKTQIQQSSFQSVMNNLNRKQIPLCYQCHKAVSYSRHNNQIKLSSLHNMALAKL